MLQIRSGRIQQLQYFEYTLAISDAVNNWLRIFQEYPKAPLLQRKKLLRLLKNKPLRWKKSLKQLKN
ncbi:hypothetical protein DOT_5125 [Desulfosporosinus sp. OT]|nr:hypothetical protein DOT_5125 [Desulfosporosinus sp. OT]